MSDERLMGTLWGFNTGLSFAFSCYNGPIWLIGVVISMGFNVYCSGGMNRK